MQIGPVWRAERPQRGRYRQFTQCDIDILGVASEIAEIELILATTEALGALGLEGLTVRINDRRLLAAMAAWCGFAPERHASVFITLDKWDKLPPGEIRRELEQAGHPAAAIGRMLELYTGPAPEREPGGSAEPLGDPSADGAFQALSRIVEAVGAAAGGRFRIDFDPTLVRGMGYYTGPIFEIRSSSFASGSIAGGGRYDGMIGAHAGPGRPRHGVLHRLRARRGHSRPARQPAGARRPADRRPVRRGGAGAGRASCGRPQALRGQGCLVALERQTRNPGAQRAALEKQGYEGVATVSGEGPPSVQWFAERVPRRSGSRT